MSTRVLLIDDEPAVTKVCGAMLTAAGFVVWEVNDPEQALAAAHEFHPDVAILDYFMPGLSGADVAWRFASSDVFRALPLVVLTGAPKAVPRSSLPGGKVQILAKPITLRPLVAAIEACLAPSSLRGGRHGR